MKACDYVEKVSAKVEAPAKAAKACGNVATVQSSLGKRHRCPVHHEGPGWKPIEGKS